MVNLNRQEYSDSMRPAPFRYHWRQAQLNLSAILFINRPVNKVFAWRTRPGNHGKFDKTSLEMELLSPAPRQARSQFREVRDPRGRKTEVFSEIAAFATNALFVI
jgi:hypothetical protein